MTNYKLKTISTTEKNLLDKKSSWYVYEKFISEEYKEFFFDELLFDLARPWPLEIKDCKFFIGSGKDEEEKDDDRWAFRGHGGTLSVQDYPSSLNNIENWEYILNKYKPKFIFETGTNSGIFGFLCYKFLGNNFELTTIDCEPNSAICVDKINEYFDNDLIEFNEMNIPHDLKGFYTETQFDFAFIDSGHDEETLTTELEFCINKNIPIIAFDDYSLSEVDKMINKFLNDNQDYEVVETFNGIVSSGMGDVKIVKRND
tara:strand:+ start:713 stop:1486 length:774 start_codon:yes stop_codon:yes gene_type:complete